MMLPLLTLLLIVGRVIIPVMGNDGSGVASGRNPSVGGAFEAFAHLWMGMLFCYWPVTRRYLDVLFDSDYVGFALWTPALFELFMFLVFKLA